MISARVFNKDGIPGPEFDHMALIVDIDGTEYLCDVGFGELCMEPLRFVLNDVQKDSGKLFRIVKLNETDYKLTRSENSNDWTDQYLFTKQKRVLAEFEPMCNYHQTSPGSHFTQNKICSIATPNGRITLRDDRVILTENGMKKEIPFEGKNKFVQHLKEYFSIDL